MELPPPGIRRVSINSQEFEPRKFSIFPGATPAHASLTTSGTLKPSTQGRLRTPSLMMPSPMPQKSSLIPPAGMRRRGSTVSSVHYADEQVKPPPLDADKEKAKEKGKGAGTKLLKMLRKTLQGSDSEEMVTAQETPNLIPFGDVVGCLAVHIKTCRQFSHRFIIQQHVNMFIRVSINHIVKCTKLRNLRAFNNEKNLVLRFDEVKYFSVQVPRRQDDERNTIFLELMQDGGNIEKPPLSLGSVESHLYEVIQFICRLEVEFMFSYGNFGYGFSHQLKPLQKIIEPSMFMKIAPPPERTDPVTNVITPQRVEYPAFLSPELNVTIGSAEASQPSTAVRLEKLREKPGERLEKMKKEYRNLNTWIEKAEYLKNLITSKVAAQDSEEVSLTEVSEQNYSLVEGQHENASHDFHYRKSDSTSNESMDKSDKENLVIPALKLSDQGFSEPFLHKNNEPDIPLPPIHSLQIIEEDEVQHSHAPYLREYKPQEERSVVLPMDEPKPSSILRITSSLQEVRHKKEKFPHFSDVLMMPDRPLGQENTNQKGKNFIQLRKSWETPPTDIVSGLRKVAFAQKEYTTSVFRGESAEFKPKHQKFIKGGLDPFLRNINSKMSFKKKKDQDTYRYPSSLSTEVAEHEDQDPPYPEHSRSAGSNTTWANDPNLITIHMVNTKNNVPPDHTTTTTVTSDRKNKLPHDPVLNTSYTKNIFTSGSPVITITKISESDYKLSTDPSSKTTKSSETRPSSTPSSNTSKPSETRLSSSPSSHTTKPSDTRLSSSLSSHTMKPSETKLSSGPSSHTIKPSDTRLSSGPSSNISKPSDTRLSSGLSSHTTKPSETRLSSTPSSNISKPSDTRLSSAPSSNISKPSDTRLSSAHSSNISKPSDTRLSSAHSSNISKPSDTRLSSTHSSNISKPSDTRLSSGLSSYTTKPSEMRLSSAPSSNILKPSDTRLSSAPSSNISKPSDTRLSSGPSSHTMKPSDTKLSSGLSSHTTKPSDTRLSSGPSSNISKPSDTRLSSGPSSNISKPSDTRLSSAHSSNISKPSDTRLSSGPSSHTTKPSDTKRLSQNPSINGNKSSDPSKLSHDASIISTKSLDNKLPSGNPSVNSDLTTNTAKTPATRDKSAQDPATVTADSSEMQSKLEQLPDVSLPNFQRESSVTGNVCIYHPSSSINFTSDIENLKQSIVLKSILSKNLKDLSDELFSTPEVCTNAEEMQESSPLPLGVHDRPSCGTEDRVFEQIQDINSWLSPKDILNSQALLSPVIKSVPQDLLPEGRPGTSSDTEDVSDKHLEAAEIHFPVNRKSSFKTKHLVSEVSGSDQGLNGGVCDYVIKQIFTAPIFSKLETGETALSKAQMALQDQVLTYWERSTSSQILTYEEKSNGSPLSRPKSGISTIIQSFPVETLLDSGIIKVIQLDKENQSSLLDVQTASPEEKLQNPTEQHHNVKSQTKLLSRQTTPSTKPTETSVNAADYKEDSQSTSTQEPNYPKAERKSDLPNERQRLDTEEAGLSSAVESLSNLMGNLKGTDTVILKSVLKGIFKNFFKYNQSETREQLEKEFDKLTQHSSPHGTEHLEKMQGNFNKAGKADKKPILDPKLCVFLEKLSESEVKNMKSELSKHIQHYLLEKLSEAGHITKEDLPQIYQNLYLMNEKTELKEQNSFQDKYSKTVEEIMSFVNNFNHHFIDKHLEIKLRSFLNEILQNYFLKNLSGSNLFNETDSVALSPSMSSMGSSSSRHLHRLGQETASGSFGSRLKINMNYPFNESLQNYLNPLSENDLLSLKADLSKYVQVLFIDKLHKSGLMTERQLKAISQQVNSLHSPPKPFKCIKPELPCRDESCFIREDSEEQKKYPKIGQNTTFRTFLEDIRGETEPTRKGEKGGSFSHSLKENPPTIWEHKPVYSREVKTLMKVQPPSNKHIQAIPLNKSPERPADILLKKHKQDLGFMQLPQAENSVYKTEAQEPYSWDSRSKPIQTKLCFEKTLKVKALEKRDNNNVCKLAVPERPDAGFSPYLKLPTCRTARENEHFNRLSFPTWRANTFIYVNTENGEQSKLDQYCQRWKENNNNNKKHLVTFAQFKNEMETLYINPYEDCKEKYARSAESQSFPYKEEEKNSRPSFFPEVLTRENMKSKRKERDYTNKPKKSFHKIVRILPAALPTARPHLRKSVPRTLLHWTARRTVHDCLDRFEDLQIPSVKRPKNSKSRARLLGKSPDDSCNQAKHCARPSTAPESNKRRESVTGKSASPRMVSAGLVHIHDTTPEYDIRKLRSKRKLKENIEKRPLIYDIIQMLDTAE